MPTKSLTESPPTKPDTVNPDTDCAAPLNMVFKLLAVATRDARVITPTAPVTEVGRL